jgi:hypothetical protein
MKWGVRRTREELRYNPESVKASLNRLLPKVVTKDGVLLDTVSKHAFERIEQGNDRKVSAKEVVDALKNPLYIDKIRIDSEGQKSKRYIGKAATVNVNPDTGLVITLWRTGERKLKKYSKKGGP